MAAPMSVKRVFQFSSCKCLRRASVRCFSITPVNQAGATWRLKRGKAEDGKRYGALTDLPDYSFLDGRPTPLGKGQMRRRTEMEEMKARMVKLIEEVDFAKENYQRKQADVQNKRKVILESKLKPKVDEFGKQLKS